MHRVACNQNNICVLRTDPTTVWFHIDFISPRQNTPNDYRALVDNMARRPNHQPVGSVKIGAAPEGVGACSRNKMVRTELTVKNTGTSMYRLRTMFSSICSLVDRAIAAL
jgi:adenylosuccinate synthase